MPTCSECSQPRNLDDFGKRADRPGGRRYCCKMCDQARRKRREYNKEYRAARRIKRRGYERSHSELPHYYMYFHVCPGTGETVYVGSGIGKRAWENKGGKRSPEHAQWLADKDMLDVVRIEARGMLRDEALELEWDTIRHLKPRFNRIK